MLLISMLNREARQYKLQIAQGEDRTSNLPLGCGSVDIVPTKSTCLNQTRSNHAPVSKHVLKYISVRIQFTVFQYISSCARRLINVRNMH